MGEITQWLADARTGDSAALGKVFEQLYPQLRELASARLGSGERTLTPTVLVHEAYVRLIGNARLNLVDRRHFFACAARAMRAIVIDHARRHFAAKRGGGMSEVQIDLIELSVPDAGDTTELLALDAALAQLEALNPRQCEVVELRYFAGLEFRELATLLDCSERTAKREWERARAFLHVHLAGHAAAGRPGVRGDEH